MKRRSLLKLLLLLPVTVSYARKSTRLYHKGTYVQSQTLTFKSCLPYSYVEVSVLSGTIDISHTTLQAHDRLIIPDKKVTLTVKDHASIIVKEIWS